jgi:hypothetical protein
MFVGTQDKQIKKLGSNKKSKEKNKSSQAEENKQNKREQIVVEQIRESEEPKRVHTPKEEKAHKQAEEPKIRNEG